MSIDLITQVKQTMSAIGHTQRDLAKETRMSQGHLSKLLSKSIDYGSSARSKLTNYVGQYSDVTRDQTWSSLIERVKAQPESAQRELMHIMHHALKIRESEAHSSISESEE